MTLKTTLFDASEYLDSPEAIIEFMADICESQHSDVIVSGLNVVARAYGMSELARQAGVSRQALYEALREGGRPQSDVMTKVLSAVGVSLEPTLAA